MGFIFSLLTICFHRHGCTIPDHENKSVIITGAGYKLGRWDRVLRYGLRGFIEELPSLINARRRHACAGYHKDGHFVSSKCLKYVLSRYLDLVDILQYTESFMQFMLHAFISCCGLGSSCCWRGGFGSPVWDKDGQHRDLSRGTVDGGGASTQPTE